MARRLVQFDWAIKSILRDKANFAVLEGFLSELLKRKVTIDGIAESESNKSDPMDKYNRVDVVVTTDAKEHILVEIQVDREWDYLKRMFYATSKLATETIGSGDAYSAIKKIIAIHIVFFDLGDGNDYLYHGHTRFKGVHSGTDLKLAETEAKYYLKMGHIPSDIAAGLTPSDVLPDYYIIKVNRFDDEIRDKFDEWVYLLKHSAIKSDFKAKGINLAEERLAVLGLNESERRDYERYVDIIRSKNSQVETQKMEKEEARESGMKEGLEEGLKEGIKKGIKEGLKEGIRDGIQIGIEQGKAEGKQEAQLAIAKKLLNFLDDQTIAENTGLSIAEISRLRK